MIVGALFEGLMDGFNEFMATGDIGKAIVAGLAGIVDFLTFGLFDKLKPKHVILHDVFDGDSISHHQMKDPFIQYGKEMNGTNDLGKEIFTMMDQLDRFSNFENVVIVRSNHDDFVDRWLKNEDWKKLDSIFQELALTS